MSEESNNTGNLLIPELILYNTIDNVLNLIRDDFQNKSNEKDTILYKIFNGTREGVFDFYKQSKVIFLQKNDSPRKLEVCMFFNSERAAVPTIHINLPQESSGEDGIGIDEGFASPHYSFEGNTKYTPTYTRRFDSMYHAIVTSDNTMEVILIYHFLRYIMISIFDHISLSGLENPKLSGQDLNIYSEIIPENVFIRGLGISFSYDVKALSLFDKDMVKNLIFCQKEVNSPYKTDYGKD